MAPWDLPRPSLLKPGVLSSMQPGADVHSWTDPSSQPRGARQLHPPGAGQARPCPRAPLLQGVRAPLQTSTRAALEKSNLMALIHHPGLHGLTAPHTTRTPWPPQGMRNHTATHRHSKSTRQAWPLGGQEEGRGGAPLPPSLHLQQGRGRTQDASHRPMQSPGAPGTSC